MNKPPDDRKKPEYPPRFSVCFAVDERRILEVAAGGRPLVPYIRWLIFKEDMPELPERRMPNSGTIAASAITGSIMHFHFYRVMSHGPSAGDLPPQMETFNAQ